MAYFLKKSKQHNKTYLAIYESFYNPDRKCTQHRSFKYIGSVEHLIEEGMSDPITHCQKEVDELNHQRNEQSVKKISDISPLIYLGYFPLKAIMEKLNIKKWVNYFNLTNNFEYDLYELLSSLIYARSVHPCSKRKTFHEVLPNLYQSNTFSYDQLLDGLAFIGNNYLKFIDIFTTEVNKVYQLDSSLTYFDCTNFYFEIDREDDFRKKGPSKENRHSPIVGLGLLLDVNQIPIGMKMYPGNQSEKPILREVIDELKKQNNITGKTIHVADKGLNCADNIAHSKSNGDGYLFSKSVKGLPEKEKTWVLLEQDFKAVQGDDGKVEYYYKSCIDEFPYAMENGNKKTTVNLKEKRLLTYNPNLAAKKKYEITKMAEKAMSLTLSKAKKNDYGEVGKYVTFTDGEGKKAKVTLNQEAIDKDLRFAGYNLLITSEIHMTDQDIYNTYHNLWRIEESFKIMKSDLDARPVYVQKEDTIKGHFLVCYLTVLLERLLQFHEFDNQFSTSEIFKFIKDFRLIKSENGRYINTTSNSQFINNLSKLIALPLTTYSLSDTQIKSILNRKF